MIDKNAKEADKSGNSAFHVKKGKRRRDSEQDSESKDIVEPKNALPDVNIEELPKGLYKGNV